MPIYQYPIPIRPDGVKVSAILVDGCAAIAGAADLDGAAAIGDATGDTFGFFGDSTTRHAFIADCTITGPTSATEATVTINSILDVLIGFGLVATA